MRLGAQTLDGPRNSAVDREYLRNSRPRAGCLALAMSTNGGDSVFPKNQHRQSGVKLVLQYTGIPPSWLDKRPSLPSRNWLIFLSVTSSIAGYYIYDRQQCKKIRKEYVAKVQHLSKLPLHSMELPRKVTVYGCKWPADEEYDRSIKYFRKYVKVRSMLLGVSSVS